MTGLDPRYRGKDFLFGLLPSSVVVVVTAAPLFAADAVIPLLVGGGGLVVAAITAFTCRRPFIAIGILTVIVASPLLLVGSCFAVFAVAQ